MKVARQSLGLVPKRGADTSSRTDAFRLPRPVSVEVLLQIAARFESCVALRGDEPLHLVAVATGGDQLAAVVLTRFALRYPDTPAWLSTVSLAKPLNIIAPLIGTGGRRPRTIVIDNAINTGRTIHEVLKLLEQKSIIVDLVVKLVDYRDALEAGVADYIGLEHDVPIKSLYTVDEIYPVADPV